jgi:Zn finger protein HypA/HybF involved in hydrogenase expression
MHEVAIARALISTAEDSARAAGLVRVTCLQVELGHDAGVTPAALAFALDVVGQGSLAEGSAIVFSGPGASDVTSADQDQDHDHDHLEDGGTHHGAIRLVWIEGD